MRKRIAAWMLTAMLLVMLAGCGVEDQWETTTRNALRLERILEDAQLREDTEAMLDAVIAGDFSKAYGLVADIVEETDFQDPYGQMRAVAAGVESYELVASNINKNKTNGVASVSVRYLMTAGDRRMIVDVTRTDGYEGLTAFYINEYVPVKQTGSLGTMKDANVLQWVFVAVGMLEVAFVVWMFADCCCHKVKRKWLWLLLIALVNVRYTVSSAPNQINFRVQLGVLFRYSRLIRYSTGEFAAQFLVPVGAVVYAVLRKNFFRKHGRFPQCTEAGTQNHPEGVQEGA